MKRAPSVDLFRLIKSLNKGEKRNFKLLAGLLAGKKEKKYLDLFDEIDKQDVYNESKLLKATKDLYGGQLAVGKHYLYRLILRSLAHFRSDPASELGNLIDHVQVLLEKDLLEQGLKLVKKGLAEAMALEDFMAVQALCHLQVEILLRGQADRSVAQRIEEAHLLRREAQTLQSNLEDLKFLNQQVQLLTRMRGEDPEYDPDMDMRLAEQSPLLRGEESALSKRALVEYHSIHRKIKSYHGDLPGARNHAVRIVGIYEEDVLIQEASLRQYFSEVSNLCTYLLRLGEVESALSKIQRFRQVRPQFSKARVDSFQLYYIVFIAGVLYLGEPERATELVPEVEEELAALEGRIPVSHAMWLFTLMAYAHLMAGKSRAALDWVNRMLNETRSEVRLDLQCDARLLNMMIHMDLENYSLVESEYQNTRRFMEKYHQLTEFERLALRALKALASHAGSPKYAETLRIWVDRLEAFEAREPRRLPRRIEFTAWVKAKLLGISMAEVMRSRMPAAPQHQD